MKYVILATLSKEIELSMYRMVSQRFFNYVVSVRRVYKRTAMILSDVVALPIALWSAYALRLADWWPQGYLVDSWWLFVFVPFFGVFVFAYFGLYRAVIRFMSGQAVWVVVGGVVIIALSIWSLAYLFSIEPFPRSVPVIFCLVALVYVGGSRLIFSHAYHWLLKYFVNKDAVLIYGAGGAGVQLVTSLFDSKEYQPIGFVDDDSGLLGATIKGLRVYGPSSIPELVDTYNVQHVLLALPNATNAERRNILKNLDSLEVCVQTIPSMPELLSGYASIGQLREVSIEELLGRDPVPPTQELMSKCIFDQVVMITGAGGSIGSELCRQVLMQSPKVLILFEISEYHLYKIEQELDGLLDTLDKKTPVYALLGNVADRSRVRSVLQHFSVDTVYHAAAYKHVPIVEHNVVEGVKNNILGTLVVAEEAAEVGVKNFILVSTDKAVRPTNVMGATKRFSEMILQNLARKKDTATFSMVRFGNVLGSSGSVVPLFRQQIEAGGPVTVTHKDITRYFMTIPEAASLVVQAGSMALGGDVFVLDMGESIKISELAERMIRLSGMDVKTPENPEGDIEILYKGLRPAEKLYEELLIGDNVIPTEHKKIMRAMEPALSDDEMQKYLSQILLLVGSSSHQELRDLLREAVVGYSPHDKFVDHLCV